MGELVATPSKTKLLLLKLRYEVLCSTLIIVYNHQCWKMGFLKDLVSEGRWFEDVSGRKMAAQNAVFYCI